MLHFCYTTLLYKNVTTKLNAIPNFIFKVLKDIKILTSYFLKVALNLGVTFLKIALTRRNFFKDRANATIGSQYQTEEVV